MTRPGRFPTHGRIGSGFTYLWLLFAIAIGGATLAAIGERWSTATQREKETELVFRGRQIERAVASYWKATPGDAKELPRSLDDLAEDRRGPAEVHHLRRLWTDPFTGRADWVLIRDEAGDGVRGVHSRAETPALSVAGLPPAASGVVRTVGERRFVFTPQASASAASGAASMPR